MLKVFLLACLGEYVVLLAGGISACLKCTEKKPLKTLLFVETLSPFTVLIITCVLLILSWLRLYDEGFAIILVVSPKRHHRFKTYAEFRFCAQVLLASMSICAARFALIRPLRVCAARFVVLGSFRVSARPNDEELELTRQERWGLPQDVPLKRPDTRPDARPDTRPGTRPGTRHADVASYSLPERGVELEDGRMLSGIINKAISSESIQWGYYLDDSVMPLAK